METSCGVVLANLGTILLLQYPQGHWDFPKGHVEESDPTPRATVRRELAEETGITDIEFVDGFMDRSEYSYRHKGKLCKKQVLWFLAETETITVDISHEHRGHMWLEWDHAEEQITHDASLAVLKAARAHMRALGRE